MSYYNFTTYFTNFDQIIALTQEMLRTTYYYQHKEKVRGVTNCIPNFLNSLDKSIKQCTENLKKKYFLNIIDSSSGHVVCVCSTCLFIFKSKTLIFKTQSPKNI